MSGKNSTGTLDKVGKTGSGESIGNQIRAIMGKAPAKGRFSIGKSKSEKEAGKLYDQAEKELTPWVDKKAPELGWLETEHEAFNTLVKAGRSLKGTGRGKSYADAADKLSEAKAFAIQADQNKQERADALTLLKQVAVKLEEAKPAAAKDPAAKQSMLDIGGRAAGLRDRLARGEDPVGLHGEAQALLDEAVERLQTTIDKLNEAKQSGSVPIKQSPEVEKVRLAQWQLLTQTRDSGLVECQKVVAKLSSPQVKSPADAMARMVSAAYSEACWIVSGPSDTNEQLGGLKAWGQTSDPERIDNLTARGKAANEQLTQACEALQTKAKQDKEGFFADAKGQEDELTGEKLREAKAKFEQEWEKVETALAQLADIGSPLLGVLRTEADQLKATTVETSDYETAPRSIQTLVTKIGYAQSQLLATTNKQAQELEAERKKLESELTKAHGRFDARLKPAYKALIEETRQLASLLTTANPAALKSAGEAMQRIRATGLGASIDKIAALVVTAEEIKSIVGDKKIATEFESQANEALLAIKTVFDTLNIYEVAAAQTTLNAVRLDAEKLRTSLAELGTWRDGISTRLVELKKNRAVVQKWQKSEKIDGADSLFEVHYKAVLDGYKSAGADRAKLEMRLVEAEHGFAKLATLTASNAPGDRAIALQQLGQAKTDGQTFVTNENAENENAKQRHAELGNRLKAYRKLWSETETLVKKEQHGDKEELAELKTLGQQAQKQWKSGEDEAAAKQLTALESRLARLNRHPGGVTAESVSQLLDVSRAWANAVEKTKSSLDGIASEAQIAAEAVRLDGGAVSTRIATLARRIERLSPVEFVLSLANKDTPSGQRKKAREQALKSVRALRDLIENDGTAAKLEVSPFGQKQPFRDLRRFLNDIEYNSLRAVPPE